MSQQPPITPILGPIPHRGTLDGKPFTVPDPYQADGSIDKSEPVMLQQYHLPPTGVYWVRHYRRRHRPLRGGEYFGMWCDRWGVADVTQGGRRGNHGWFGRVYMIGANSRETEDIDFSEAQWLTLTAPPPVVLMCTGRHLPIVPAVYAAPLADWPIVPAMDHPPYAWTPVTLWPLCTACHDALPDGEKALAVRL